MLLLKDPILRSPCRPGSERPETVQGGAVTDPVEVYASRRWSVRFELHWVDKRR